jgi:N-hydroxyarylamine O-acetyltransferase
VDLGAYFARIGYSGSPKADLRTFRAIHRAHLAAIPYENLDVRLGRPGGLSPAVAYGKLVTRRRGGWCYEMNGVLAWALEEIGFSVTRLAGAVLREERGDAVIGNHMVLKVALDGRDWLADVGLGDGLLEPIPIEAGDHQVGGYDFRLERLDEQWWRLHNHPLGGARNFDFTLAPADAATLAGMCHWLRTSPDSIFTQAVLAYRHAPDGWVVVLGRILRILRRITPTTKRDHLIESPQELVAILRTEFGLDVPEAAGLWPSICAKHEELAKAEGSTL